MVPTLRKKRKRERIHVLPNEGRRRKKKKIKKRLAKSSGSTQVELPVNPTEKNRT